MTLMYTCKFHEKRMNISHNHDVITSITLRSFLDPTTNYVGRADLIALANRSFTFCNQLVDIQAQYNIIYSLYKIWNKSKHANISSVMYNFIFLLSTFIYFIYILLEIFYSKL